MRNPLRIKMLMRVAGSLMLQLSAVISTHATVITPMYLDDLTSASQTVAVGTVTAKRVEWNAAHTMIYTVYTVERTRYLKGGLGDSFELHEPGGEIGNEGMRVAAVPRFEVGEEAVLFVWSDSDRRHQVAAFEQGAIAIATDPETGAKTAMRSIPLGSVKAEKVDKLSGPGAASQTLSQRGAADTLAIPSISAPSASSRSLSELMEQIRISAARTQR